MSETKTDDAKLAEIRARHELSCGERNHGEGPCELREGGCRVCEADAAAIDDRATLLSHLAAAQEQQAAQAATIAGLRNELEKDAACWNNESLNAEMNDRPHHVERYRKWSSESEAAAKSTTIGQELLDRLSKLDDENIDLRVQVDDLTAQLRAAEQERDAAKQELDNAKNGIPDYWKDAIGGSYTPVKLTKYSAAHSSVVRRVLEAEKGEEAADVIAALVFQSCMAWDNARTVSKHAQGKIASLESESTALRERAERAERAEGELAKMRDVLSDVPSSIIGKAQAFVFAHSCGSDLEDMPDEVVEVKGWLQRRQEALNPTPTPAAQEGE